MRSDVERPSGTGTGSTTPGVAVRDRFRVPPRVLAKPAAAAAVVALVGLYVQSLGYAAGRAGDMTLALTLYYVGLVVLLAPYALLLLSARPSRRSRVVGVVSFGLLMYGSWLAASPIYPTAFDESLHVVNLEDLTSGDGWFSPNAMLPVSPHYPGLELAASAVSWTTGLPLMACQVIVVATSRVTLVLALYLIGSRLTRSARGGGLVVLLYAASPQFYLFNAMFSYQTMALALLVAAVAFQLRAFDAPPDIKGLAPGGPGRALLGAQVCLAALVVTHHLTSWLTVAALWLLAFVLAVSGDRQRAKLAVVSAQLGLLLVICWGALIAPLLASYLGPVAGGAGAELLNVIQRDGTAREALAENPDNAAPLWQTVVMAGSLLTWGLLLLPALRAALVGRTLGRSPVRFLLMLLAASFPALFLVRASPSASEIADRASTFVTLGLVLVIATWLLSRRDGGRPVLDRIGLAVSAPVVVVMLVGGLILGSGPDWQRTPGPYLAGAEQRSVDGQTLGVAEWAGRYLPEGSRVAADNTFSRVLPTLAPVVPVTSGLRDSESIDVTPLFIATSLDVQARQILIRGEVDFVVVDRRWEGQTVRSGSFSEGSNGYGAPARNLTAEQLGKFEGAPGFRLVLDGPVQVYDVRGLRGEPQVFADRDEPGLPGEAHPVRAAISVVVLALLGLVLLTRRRRRRWTRGDGYRFFLVLPSMVALGAFAVTTGMSTAVSAVLGALAGLGLVAGAVALIRRHTEHDPSFRRRVPVALGVVVLVAVIAAISVTTSWNQLFDVTLPPPPTAAPLS